MKDHKQRHRDSGFSLVELMVALTIGLIILAAVSSIFANAKRSYNTQERNARVQENGRFAMHYLIKDLRLAGYVGCPPDLVPDENFQNLLNTPSAFAYTAQVPVEGLVDGAAAWTPSGDSTLPTKLAGTEAITIRLLDPTSAVSVAANMATTTEDVPVSSVSGFNVGDIVMIGDCAKTDLVQITDIGSSSPPTIGHQTSGPSPGNSSNALGKPYNTVAKVMQYAARRYYIRNNDEGVPTLYRDTNLGAAEPLVDGIEDMQILYGVDTDVPPDLIPNQYVRANAVTNWATVVSVRIGILARTLNQKDADIDTNVYDVNGKSVGPLNDHFQRRVFLSTIEMRNLHEVASK